MQPEETLAQIQARLRAAEEREDQIEARFNRRMDRAEQRMDRAEKRMEKFDDRLEKTRRLVEAGMKYLVRYEQRRDLEIKAMKEDTRLLQQALRAYIESRHGGNGNGRKRG